ncbi:MAG: type II secretion system protein M [Candidatus Nitrotoga sp.]
MSATLKTHSQAFIKKHWLSRTSSERQILTFAAGILIPLLAYFLLWQPARTAVEKLQINLPTMRAQALQLQAQTAEVARLRHLPKPAVLDAQSLKSAVEAAVARHKIHDAISALDKQEPNAVQISLAAISFEKWLHFLHELQREQHVRAESISIAALPQTGMVKINAVLSSGGVSGNGGAR